MGNILQTIEYRLRGSINVIDMSIIDESINHADHYVSHSASPSHITLTLVSDDFVGMDSLKRHRSIYEILKSEVELIHAISLHLYTQSEYNLKNEGEVFIS